MDYFKETTYLSKIIENSTTEPVVIFKYSNNCGTSTRLIEELKKNIDDKTIVHPIYLVTVQKQKALSKQIENYFQIKHESPQILILNKGDTVFSANHLAIKIQDFKYE